MKIKFIYLPIALFLILFLPVNIFGKNAVDVINPVLPGDRPDPTVIKIGNEYWASVTSNEWNPLFPMFKSNDLVNWELVSYIFPDGAPEWASHNFWAPELSYDSVQKKVYAYYTAREKSSKCLAIAVAVADNPLGPFKDLGPLVVQEVGSIDAFEIRDENGKLYLLWKEDGNSKGLPTYMWAQEITEDRTKLIDEMYPLFYNDTLWEESLVEGICVFKKNGYFYALYSASSCCDKNCKYKTGVARSKNLLGQWEKYDKNPILVDNADWRCPGHGTFVEYAGEDYYLYHAYNRESWVYVGRQGVLEQLYWGEDGWPYFKNDARHDRENENLNFTDNFDEKTLCPAWQWQVTQKINYSTGKKGLLLGATQENRGLGTILAQPIIDINFSMTAMVNANRTNSSAGIGYIGRANNRFGAPLAGIGISISGNSLEVWQNFQGKKEILKKQDIPLKKAVQIRMNVKGGSKLSFEYIENKQWKSLAEDIDASPFIPWGTGFRIGLFAEGQDGTVANFEKVEITYSSF